MAYFDVFNGDADGICALLQLRQHTPRSATLVTGVKRDIGLLNRVAAASGDLVTVLDVAVEKNRSALDSCWTLVLKFSTSTITIQESCRLRRGLNC